MMRAFKLYTGPDNASHVLEGTIDEKDRTDVIAIHFKETPAHSSYDWQQYRQRSQVASDRRSAVAARICSAETRCQGLVRTEYRHLRHPSAPPFLAAMP